MNGEAVTVSGTDMQTVTLASGATVTFDADGNFTYDPNGQFEALDGGDATTDSFTYTVDAGDGLTQAETVTVSLTGVNDAPVATDVDKTAPAGNEDAVLNVTIAASEFGSDVDEDDDVDLDEVTFGAVTVTIGGVATPFASLADIGGSYDDAGTLTIDPTGVALFQAMDETESATVEVEFTLDDGNGGTSDAATLSVQIDGRNDLPVSQALDLTAGTPVSEDDARTIEIGSDITLDEIVTDVDDTLTPASISFSDAEVDFSEAGRTDLTGQSQTDVGFDYDASTGTFTLDVESTALMQTLDDGETATVTVNFTADDGTGTAPGTVSYTVTGSNDAPVAQDPDFSGDPITEDEEFDGTLVTGTPSGPKELPLSLFATDVDNVLGTDAITFDDADVTIGNTTLQGLSAAAVGISYDPATGAFQFDPRSIERFEELADGEFAIVEANYTVTDGDASDTGTVTFRVDGVNDPVVIATPADTTADLQEAEGTATDTLSFTFSDADTSDTPTVSTTLVSGTGVGAAATVATEPDGFTDGTVDVVFTRDAT